MMQSIRIQTILGVAAFAAAQVALANGTGSPVCNVPFLPLSPMSSVLINPAPSGWRIDAGDSLYSPGQSITWSISNVDPLKKVRGVLMWAQYEDLSPAGSFLIGPGTLWRYVAPSPSAQCEQGSITHSNKFPKLQSALQFTWTAPVNPIASIIKVQAFLIEDCGADLNVNCRGAQALTQELRLQEGIFRSSFE
jgi:Reeler domain